MWYERLLFLLKYLAKNVFLQKALLLLFKTATPVGFKAWLAKFVLERLNDWVIEEGIEITLETAELVVNKVKGRITVKKIKKANNENNESDFDRAIDDGMHSSNNK